jgi:predicted PurR-regulated permease PerM
MNAARQLRFWLIGLVLLLLALYFLGDILLPFVAGMALAYILDPFCDRVERWGCSRTLATTVVMIGVAALIVALLLLVVPLLRAQIVALIERLPEYLKVIDEQIVPRIERLAERFSMGEEPRAQQAVESKSGEVLAWLSSAALTVLSGGLAIVNLLSLVFIMPIVAFYLLRDWDRIVAQVDGWLPRAHAETLRALARQIDRTLSGFVRGQALVCIVLALYNGIGLTLIGLDFGLAIGVISGVLSFIPYVGTIFGLVASTALAMVQFGDWRIGLVAGLFILGQLVEGNFLTPKLVGDRVGLHAVWIIFALLAGGALFGFVGLLVAVPVAAEAGVLARFALQRYLASPYYDGRAVVPPPAGPRPGA